MDGAGDGGEFEAGRQAVDALRQGVEAGRRQQGLGGAGGLARRGADAGAGLHDAAAGAVAQLDLAFEGFGAQHAAGFGDPEAGAAHRGDAGRGVDDEAPAALAFVGDLVLDVATQELHLDLPAAGGCDLAGGAEAQLGVGADEAAAAVGQ